MSWNYNKKSNTIIRVRNACWTKNLTNLPIKLTCIKRRRNDKKARGGESSLKGTLIINARSISMSSFVANLNFWKINLRNMSPRGQPELTPVNWLTQPELTPVNWLTQWTILQTTWPLLQVTPGSLRLASCELCFFNKIHLYFLASGKSILLLNCLLDVQCNNFECRPAKFFFEFQQVSTNTFFFSFIVKLLLYCQLKIATYKTPLLLYTLVFFTHILHVVFITFPMT